MGRGTHTEYKKEKNIKKNKKKDNKKNKKEEFELCQGVKLLNNPEITRHRIGESSMRYMKRRELTGKMDSHGILSKCVLEVLAIWGTMVGFLTSIECAYNIPLILVSYILLALFFSWLFKSGKTWVRDLWYVAFLVLFVGFVVVFRKYINSGFYAMINEFLDHVTDYYGASEVKVFSEAIENRPITVPIAAEALGPIQIIILNIFLNNSMSVLWAVVFTLPPYVAPLFFRLEPDVIPMLMGIAGLIGIICLKGNGHYRITDAEATFRSEFRKRKMVYRHSDRVSLQLIVEITVLCVLVFVVMTVVKPSDRYYYRYKNSSIKEKIEAPLGNLIMYGYESLRNTANTGGLASGRLGAVSDVTFDGGTDLVVRFAPYSSDRIYLKAFTGYEYSWDHWDSDKEGLYPSPDGIGTVEVAGTDSDTSDIPTGKMYIQNVDGMNDLLYYPYYTSYDDDLEKAMTDVNETDISEIQEYDENTHALTVEYSPDVQSEPMLESVDEKYLDIPEINIPVVAEFCENAGIEETDSADVKIQKVYSYFETNYPYTLHPGATPRKEDYVNYFLQTTRKGLCANYATAGTLILRYLGIPARYIEGYVIDYTDVVDSEILDESSFRYEDYFRGESELGRTAVVQVNVTDNAAHAWIEAFMDGRWQVVELTPPSGEDEDENTQDFWSRIGRWLAGDSEDGQDGYDGTNVTSFSLNRYSWIIYGLAGIILFIAVIFIGRVMYRKIIRIHSYNGNDIRENIVAYYRYMCDYARIAEPDFVRAGSHREQLRILMPDMSDEAVDILTEKLEFVLYREVPDCTGVPVTDVAKEMTVSGDQTMQSMFAMLRGGMSEYKKKMPFIRRIYLFGKI